MDNGTFSEGVRPGGLTSSTEIRILLCYLLDHIGTPVSREQIEESLLGESLVNYFAMADSLAQLCSQGLLSCEDSMYTITDEGRTVGRTLAADVPRTIRDAAVRGVIRAQQYAAKAAAHRSEVIKSDDGKSRHVRCSIGDDAGTLLLLELYMPDELSAEAVRDKFIQSGDEVYKLVLASLTGNRELAQKALAGIEETSDD
ncbi:DUF4364 family protein [Ruminococcaceae bacterium OttesenSCG-928-D13]|nr:DUF4364 family protein [Ruminococcaceae bacterium OttesenSCG-928-D13]